VLHNKRPKLINFHFPFSRRVVIFRVGVAHEFPRERRPPHIWPDKVPGTDRRAIVAPQALPRDNADNGRVYRRNTRKQCT
jgi:hypothetical protein